MAPMYWHPMFHGYGTMVVQQVCKFFDHFLNSNAGYVVPQNLKSNSMTNALEDSFTNLSSLAFNFYTQMIDDETFELVR